MPDAREGNRREAGPFFLGVDGGGSKTLAVLVDASGRERGRGRAGSSNAEAVGLQRASAHLVAAVQEAAHTAACELPVASGWFGLAGVDTPHDTALWQPQLVPLATTIRLTNDAELALSALERPAGVALVAGTGSIAVGRDAGGRVVRAGGWGHLLGDEGSGYDIGIRALRAATRAADGRGPATALLDLILRHWELTNASDIFAQVYQRDDKARIARLSPLVFNAAREGDAVARGIVRRAAAELAHAVLTVASALDLGDEPLALALAGGVLLSEHDFQADVVRRITAQRTLGPVSLVAEPVLCAARALATERTL